MNGLKAFHVQDEWGEGHAVVVYHTSNAAARRIGCSEMDEPWERVSCRRAPEFDQYAPGPVPGEAYMRAGWWQMCGYSTCCTPVYPDEPEAPYFLNPARPEAVFCSAEHAALAPAAIQSGTGL